MLTLHVPNNVKPVTAYLVLLDRPEGASQAEVEAYIRLAVQCERGLCHPEDPMSKLDPETVRVRAYHVDGVPDTPS